MSKRSKAIEHWGRSPHTVRFDDVDALLLYLGFDKRQGGGSHTIYTLGTWRINIPYRRPFIHSVYVKQLLALLDEIED